eukprot:TRINITY_DN4263_c0_g1_i1.p1 TRINITY_DN4263_c0_g1~~TRINITY_DN4263_c0_g1_i1.p1  ORF type:complete len:262 (-),score=6.92 TRINITY_DN4263_c0_g1_i1:48-833(-)
MNPSKQTFSVLTCCFQVTLIGFLLLLVANISLFLYDKHSHSPLLQSTSHDDDLIQSLQNRECKRILWVMGMTWTPQSLARLNQVKYAVITQKLRAPSLLPMLMFKGPKSNPFISWLQANGVIVCNIQNSIEQELNESNVTKSQQGIYFRMVVNEYIKECLYSGSESNIFSQELELEYVLYTDTDISFFQDIDSCNLFKPKTLAFGAEVEKGEGPVNTGVLIFNLPKYLEHQAGFFDYCRSQNWRSYTWDQELYQVYFRGSV